MALSGSESGTRYSAGAKQTSIAIEEGIAVKVFVAADAEVKITNPIIERCRELGIPLEEVPSMRELGQNCGIQVGAAAAAMVRK